jgi:dTDP-N-acetylfucosamine:lipid II N-acetylfucosaminyltransferase
VFLHLIQSDRKFVRPIRSLFEAAAPGRHRYIVVGDLAEGLTLPVGTLCLSDSAALSQVLHSESDWEGVVVHGLPFEIADTLLSAIPQAYSIAWYVWGFEAYESWPRLSSQLLMPETRRVSRRLAGPAWKRWVTGSPWLARRRERTISRVASRYDYCVAPFHEEHDLFIETGILRSTKFHWGSYGSLKDYVDVHEGIGAGEDIQLGNSASLTNNHLDALPWLCGSAAGSRQVVVPLTYGDRRYRDVVVAAGRECLGSRFSPLVDFVEREDYVRMLHACGHVVMNHHRQQAVGNILASLWRGARLYMNDTTVCRALKRQGFEVKMIEEVFGRAEVSALPPCTSAQASRHRELLGEHLYVGKVLAETNDLLDRLSTKPHMGGVTRD